MYAHHPPRSSQHPCDNLGMRWTAYSDLEVFGAARPRNLILLFGAATASDALWLSHLSRFLRRALLVGSTIASASSASSASPSLMCFLGRVCVFTPASIPKTAYFCASALAFIFATSLGHILGFLGAQTSFAFGDVSLLLVGAVTSLVDSSVYVLFGVSLKGVWMSMSFMIKEKSSSSSS